MTTITRTSALIVLSSDTRRGAELQGSALAAELLSRGLDTRVVSLAPAQAGVPLGTEVIGKSPLSLPTLRALRRISRRSSVVIGYGSKTLPACAGALTGLPTPFIYRSIGNPDDWVRGRWHRWRTGRMFRRADHVAALWPGAAKSVEHLYRVDPKIVNVIPNARAARHFLPADEIERTVLRRDLGIAPDEDVVLFIGSLSQEKRPEFVSAVAEELPGAVFLILGDGPLRGVVDQSARSSAGNVRVLGATDDVRSVLACADVILSPSRTEGMPGSLIEAALMSIPSVATDVGAVSEVVGDRGRVLSANATPREFADAVLQVLDNRHFLGKRARTHALAHFTWDVVAPQWIDLIDAV